MRSLLFALQFLTIVPVRLDRPPQAGELGRSLLWYPAIGLLIGGGLASLARILPPAHPLLGAALLLAALTGISGALHLDGLADTVDGWVGGRGNRERTLAIMKDPHAGPMAVSAVVIVLLLKFAALETLLAGGRLTELLVVPALSRAAMPLLLATTPYVRANGIGSIMAAEMPRRSAVAVSGLLASAAIFQFPSGAAMTLPVATGIFFLSRSAMLRRIGGTTGDTCGALLEIIETVLLLGLALSA